MEDLRIAKAPLFRDPIYDGAADPVIIWNRLEKAWWIFYTNRRVGTPSQGVEWVHGTSIGIAESRDNGATWIYRGTAQGLNFEKGHNTYWAPEIIFSEGKYHMYVSYIRGIPSDWKHKRQMLHYVSDNLWDWDFVSEIKLSSDKIIDACIYKMPSGKWRMWYKDEKNSSHTFAADSDNLYDWEVVGEVISDCSHEGPNVFELGGYYWLIVDTWKGQGVYRSSDCSTWQRQDEKILSIGGVRKDDETNGLHADVLIQGEKGFIFYFTHPDRRAEVVNGNPNRSSLQVALLSVIDGILCCDRNQAFDFYLENVL